MQWRPIEAAPLRLRELAIEHYGKAGQLRYRVCCDTEIIDGRLVLKTYVLWTGFAHEAPVTHWLDESLPEPPL